MTDTTNRANANPTTELRWLKRTQILIGDLQPRKHFEQAKLDKMVAVLKEHGFDPGISRLLVRPLVETRVQHEPDSAHWFIQGRNRAHAPNATDGWETVATADSTDEAETKQADAQRFELVLGECRYRGSEVAGIGLLPVVVQELSDLEVLKKQLVENMQRTELNAMEEALAFRRLTEMGQTREQIAASVGFDVKHVDERLTLCRLEGSPAATAIETDAITPTHGKLLARVPSLTLRNELLEKVLNPPDGSPAPWSKRSLEAHIKLDYVVGLRPPRFDQEDEGLVTVEFEEGHEFENEHRRFGGACFATHGETGERLDCPFNVATNDLDRKSGSRMCMNPECFRMKEIATHERWRESVVAPGRETLPHALNAELWNEIGRALAFHSPYVELDQCPADSELRADAGSIVPWKYLIKDQAVPIVLGRDTAGKVHELVRHDLAKKAAHLNGHKIFRDSEREQRTDQERSSTAATPAQSRDEVSESQTLETKRQRDVASRIKQAEIEAIVAAAEGKARNGMLQIPKPFWQQLLFTLLGVGESFDSPMSDSISHAVLQRRGLELAEASVTGLTLGQQLGLVVELLMAFEDQQTENWAEIFAVKLAAVRRKAEKRSRKPRKEDRAGPETANRKEDEQSASAQGSGATRKAA